MKTVLVGAVDSTKVALEVMAECGALPSLLITLPKKDSGIHSDFVDLRPLANQLGVRILLHKDVNAPECIEAIRAIDPAHIFVIGWSRLCHEEFIGLARDGAIGFHPTLLPLMRGRSALAWTILLDLRQTGSSLFWIDEGTDSGAIAAQASFDLSGDEYLSDLMSMQMNNLRTMLRRLMVDLTSGNRPATPQIDENATYLAVRRPEDGRIDWGQDADAVLRIVRAVSRPYPGAFGFLGENTFRIWRARIVDMRNWFALPGQIFTTIDGCPVIRCGGQTSILIEDFQIESQDGSLQTVPKLGNQRRLF